MGLQALTLTRRARGEGIQLVGGKRVYGDGDLPFNIGRPRNTGAGLPMLKRLCASAYPGMAARSFTDPSDALSLAPTVPRRPFLHGPDCRPAPGIAHIRAC